MSEDDKNGMAKIIRIPENNLIVPTTESELKYRDKFLPDPKKLDDVKLVCTVCCVSLAAKVHNGADLYVHRALSVLMCEKCYIFYGNGDFSTEEDNDDKYCRWCGQGGMLYVCSSCTCAFCKKCVRQNMKPSALADLKSKYWKCYICVPRPLYGCRTICWAAQELNLIGKEKKRSKLKSQADRLKKIAERKKQKSLQSKKKLFDEDGLVPKKRRRGEESESEDGYSSVDPTPQKKRKTYKVSCKTNVKTNKAHLGYNSDSQTHNTSSESEDEKVNCKLKKSNNRTKTETSLTSDSDQNARLQKKHSKSKKQFKVNESQDKCYSSLSESSNSSSKTFRKKKSKRTIKRYSSSSESSVSDSKKHRRIREKRQKRSLSPDSENKESTMECRSVKTPLNNMNGSKGTHNNTELEAGDAEKNGENIDQSNLRSSQVREDRDSSKEMSASKKTEESLNKVAEPTDNLSIIKDDTHNNMLIGSDCHHSEQTKESLIDEYSKTEKDAHNRNSCSNLLITPTEEEKEDGKLSSVLDSMDQVMEDNIKCAAGWLGNTLNDIGELGGVISIQAAKFSERKIHPTGMSSLEEVVETLSKLKKFIKGIHDNYEEIETNMDCFVTPWKIRTGLEKADTAKPMEVENANIELLECSTSNDCDERTEVRQSELTSECDERKEVHVDEVLNIVPEDKESHPVEPANEAEIEQSEGLVPGEGPLPLETNLIPVCKNSGTLPGLEESLNDNETEPNVNAPGVLTIISAAVSSNTHDLLPDSGDGAVGDDNSDEVTKAAGENQVEVQLEPQDVNEHLEVSEHPENLDDFQELTVTSHIKEEILDAHNKISNKVNSLIDSSDNINVTTDLDNFEIEISKSERLIGRLEKKLNEILNPVEKEYGPETFNEVSFERPDTNNKEQEKDNFEALQAMLYSSSDDELGSSSSDDSSEIHLDDSDLDETTKKKVLSSKPKKKDDIQDIAKNKDNLNKEGVGFKNSYSKTESRSDDKTGKLKDQVEDESNEAVENLEEKMETNHEDENEGASKSADSSPKKKVDEIDSEEEINILTDLNQLKKKSFARKLKVYTSSEDSSDEESGSDSDEEVKIDPRKGMKYKNESKKRREEGRNELFGFLDEASNSEGELDISRNDLDNIEDQYATSSSDSMSLQVFGQRLSEKWKEMEKEQEDMNLKMLLASESDEDTQGRDDISSDSDDDSKRKKKVLKEKVNKGQECKGQPEEEVHKSDNEMTDSKESDKEIKVEADDDYGHFLNGILTQKTKFQGLGSTTEESQSENEEMLKLKQEKNTSEEDTVKESLDKPKLNLDFDSSDSSVILEDMLTKDKEKEKNIMKKLKKHKLFKLKLSDTDTSDEERWWQKRIQKEQKKKVEGEDRKRNGNTPEKKKHIKKSSNEKEKRVKTRSDDSSTLDLSSTDSSGTEVFKKKKKKKAKSSGSDGSSGDDKKKKKKRRNLSGDSSDDSSNSDSDVVAISQKSNQGESPKGSGRKNIRKLMTKHELAAATKAAAKEEEERRKRIAARQKMFNEIFEVKEAEVLEKLVLDFDPETKTELIAVEKDLVNKMKPHQAKGVKFMWDSCFESLSQVKNNKGSGCILAHCMGLGKTFQVISLVHTILKHKDTNVKTVLVVCPLSTVLNWYSEFDKWLEDVHKGRDIKVYHLTKYKKAHERSRQLLEWKRTGGVMIVGYELFRILTNPDTKKFRLTLKEAFQETLIDPGADLVVCDEGHMLKNESTILSKAMSRIRTLRRIVLTGTPMQNNLKEYHCMVQFVKPNLLGTRKEFLNQFVNPITNGQFVDSTEADVKVMKRRSHVLHKMLEGLVQRCDYSVLTPFLPPKHEYVISVRLTELQVRLYQFYLDHFSQKSNLTTRSGSQLFSDWQGLTRIWTHPYVLKLNFEKYEHERQKKADEESEDDKSSIDGKSSSVKLSSSHSSSSSDENCDKKDKFKAKSLKTTNSINNMIEAEINLISSDEEPVEESRPNEAKETNVAAKSAEIDECTTENVAEEAKIHIDEVCERNVDKETGESKIEDTENSVENATKIKQDTTLKDKESKKIEIPKNSRSNWWKDMVEPEHFEELTQSGKLILLFAILKECELIEDKVLVFSQSLFSLDLVEHFLAQVDQAPEETVLDESFVIPTGTWKKGLDYFRLDGSTAPDQRSAWVKAFNRDDNPRARLFLISTRAGGLGINLTGANRVIIFDASWNPSHDIQSIFRIYRFGQKKTCYVYRFIASGTMEEKVYDRQVAKQSLSSRVVDEQQVERHFSTNDLNELYRFTPPGPIEDRPTPALPKDRLMAELLALHNTWIEKYHEHDSLLENISEEELNEEERKLAWEDYENEKKKGLMPTTGPGYTYGGVGALSSTPSQMDSFRKSLMNKYPNASEAEMNGMMATLINQLHNRPVENAQKFIPQPQPKPSTSNALNQFQQSNYSLTREQIINAQKSNLLRKYGQYVPNNVQRIGNSVMRQNQRNENSQLRGQTNYLDGMRKQQEANLERLKNQQKYQNNTTQSMSNRTNYNRFQQATPNNSRAPQQAQNSNAAQANGQVVNQQQTQNSQLFNNRPTSNQQFVQSRPQLQNQASIQNRSMLSNKQNRGPINNTQQNISSLKNLLPPNGKVLGNNSQNRNRFTGFTLPNNTQSKNQFTGYTSRANRSLANASNNANVVPKITKVVSLQKKLASPQQKVSQEEMAQRISAMQHRKQRTLQQKLQQKALNAKNNAANHRKLEEMEKRYKATRQPSTSQNVINIVEIDDDA